MRDSTYGAVRVVECVKTTKYVKHVLEIGEKMCTILQGLASFLDIFIFLHVWSQ